MKMRRWKRALGVIALLLVVALFAGVLIRQWRADAEAELLQELYAAHQVLVQQPDFIRMKAEGEWLRLLLADGTERVIGSPTDMLSRFMRPWPHPYRLVGGWKNGDDVFFMTGGAVDDCWGYVVSESAEVPMDGLHVLRRVGGNVYYFSTMAE